MKNTTKLKAIVLSLLMLIGLIPLTSFAQSDGFIFNDDEISDRDAWAFTLNTQNFGATPVGSGLLILGIAGAGYAVAKRRRSKRDITKGTALLLAGLMLVGMTNCRKKVDTIASVGDKVHITVMVNGGRSVDPTTGVVTLDDGDKLYVGYNGAQVGLLTYDGSAFSGEITISKDGEQPLYFYYLDGQELVSGKVDISDQSSGCPVISMGVSDRNYDAAGSYSTTLLNQCGLVEFTTATTTAPVHVGGMYTEVTIDHSSHTISHTATEGFVTLRSESETSHWAVLLLQAGVDDAKAAIGHVGYTVDVPEVTANAYLHGGDAVVISTPSGIVYLDWLTGNYTTQDGETLTGTLGGNYKVSIADGATVTLNNATISYSSNGADYAGLTLLGDGTIVLTDGTTNTVVGGLDGDGYSNWPGIFVPQGKTLTINGNTGVLNAARGGDDTDFGSPAGIGASWKNPCGNIVINGGVINAVGGAKSAGIGGTFLRTCGDITINGGTITATGNKWGPGIGLGGPMNASSVTSISGCNITITGGNVTATGGWGGAGIGTGYAQHKTSSVTITLGDILISGGTVTATGGEGAAGIGTGGTNSGNINNCGSITITNGVTSVTATKGSGATNSIGKGSANGTCGTVTIGGVEGAITESPYTYPAPATYTLLSAATTADVGKVVCSDGHLHDAKTAVPAGCTAVGILGKVTETGHGLILALQDATSQTWNTIDGWASVTTYASTTLKVLPDDAARGSLTSYTTLGETAVSNWCVAQKSDYDAIFTNLGSTTGDYDGNTYDANVNDYIITGVGGTAISGSYWSATEESDDAVWDFYSDAWYYDFKTRSNSVRPVLAF